MQGSTQVYRLGKTDFEQEQNKGKCYAFALRTSKSGKWPNETYFTTNPLQYLGSHMHSEEWGQGDGGGGAETFIDNEGKTTRIEYDYDGNTCFVEVPCKKTDMGLKPITLKNVQNFISNLRSKASSSTRLSNKKEQPELENGGRKRRKKSRKQSRRRNKKTRRSR